MTDRHDTITITLDEPYREDDLEPLLTTLRQHQWVSGVEAGRVESHALAKSRHELRNELWDVLFDKS